DIAVADLSVASVRPRTWEECRNLACALGGPNPALPPTVAYSEAHYNEVMKNPELAGLTGYQILFIDSLTAAARLSFAGAEQQPQAISDRGRKDLRAIYGAHARNMLSWLNQLRTLARAPSSSWLCSRRTLTSSTSQLGNRRSRAPRPGVSCQRSST